VQIFKNRVAFFVAMKCEICNEKIAETFLGKRIGTVVKDEKGKMHNVCNDCQKKLKMKEEMLSKL